MQQGLTMQYDQKKQTELQNDHTALAKDKDVKGDSNDTNYIFLRFVVDHLPERINWFADCSYFFIGLGIHCCLTEFTFIGDHQRYA